MIIKLAVGTIIEKDKIINKINRIEYSISEELFKYLKEIKHEYTSIIINDEEITEIITIFIKEGLLLSSDNCIIPKLSNSVFLSFNTFFMSEYVSIDEMLLERTQQIIMVGVPYYFGSIMEFQTNSINILREVTTRNVSLLESQTQNKIFDLGDLEVTINQNLALDRIRKLSEKIFKSNNIPIFIGGDHSITLSIIKGCMQSYEDIKVYVFDAHKDCGYQRWEVVENGSVIRDISKIDNIKKIYQLGIREDSEIKCDKVKSIQLDNIDHTISDSNVNSYLSIDLDVFSPSFISAVNYPVYTNESDEKILEAIKNIIIKNKIIGIDVVEYNAKYEMGNNVSATNISKVLSCLINTIGGKINEKD